jgi:hypothetical protein
VTALLDVRAKLAAVLAPQDDDDPDVHEDYIDALHPPCVMVTWADPWLELDTGCLYRSRPQLLLVAGRVEPGAGVATLEQMVSDVLARLGQDSAQWPVRLVTSPRVFEIGGVSYLGARIELDVRVTASTTP